jgi:hypothetical protein
LALCLRLVSKNKQLFINQGHQFTLMALFFTTLAKQGLQNPAWQGED